MCFINVKMLNLSVLWISKYTFMHYSSLEFDIKKFAQFSFRFWAQQALGRVLIAPFSVLGLLAFRRGTWLVPRLLTANHTKYLLAHRLGAIWLGSYDGLNVLQLKWFKTVKIHFSPVLTRLPVAVKRGSDMEKVIVVTGANRWDSESY